LSFVVREGEKISVVGENGEGKSTVVKLLLGLFLPDSGEILINGKSLFAYSDKARSCIFGTVFQDFVRYSISAKENVELGNIDAASAETFSEAIKKAQADEFIVGLSNGADTLLGRDFDGGVDLSGGQWQRIAIARAFMGDKPVLILDEPTSQLDPIAESKLYGEFAEMAAGKTAIFITHRLASTMITDRIFVISDGKITENGTHTELMQQGGLYADMFEAQKQWYIFDHETDIDNDKVK
jgi:ATP-binding cassette subfamily B protein